MKKAMTFLVLMVLIFFIGGYFLVKYGLMKESLFLLLATIVGGLTSAISLLSLVRPSISTRDIQNLELDSLKSITQMAEDIHNVKQKAAITKSELERLEAQKIEMEFLVKKASLSLFLHERSDAISKQLWEIIRHHKEIPTLLAQYSDVIDKLKALDEEIEQDKNVSLLKDVIRTARVSQGVKDPFTILFESFARILKA